MRNIVSPQLALRLRDFGFDLPVAHVYRLENIYLNPNPNSDPFEDYCNAYKYYQWCWNGYYNPLIKYSADGIFRDEFYDDWVQKNEDNEYINWNENWKNMFITDSEYDPKNYPDIPEDLLRKVVVYNSEVSEMKENNAYDKYCSYLFENLKKYPELYDTDLLYDIEANEEKEIHPYKIDNIISAPTGYDIIEWFASKGIHVIQGWTGTHYTLELAEYPNLVTVEGQKMSNLIENITNSIIDLSNIVEL